jgi:polysaccharide deacetylase family protein (PEP-CTERM system associated)
MRNALSIDLEDWFCVENLREVFTRKDWDKCELRIGKSTGRILELLSKHNTKATFFVLGWIAEQIPALVGKIEEEGHEIATHGYSHTPLTLMTQRSFRKDLERALEVTKRCSREVILGFRAPSFSITEKTLWAFEVLEKVGIRYDSSVFPIGFHPDYGMPDAPLSIYSVSDRLTEFPLSCVEMLGKRVPCSGGGYFRVYPYWLTRAFIKRCNREGRPVVFYIHPWEFDPDQPRIDLPIFKRWRHYSNLDRTFERFDRLLGDFEFATIREVLGL